MVLKSTSSAITTAIDRMKVKTEKILPVIWKKPAAAMPKPNYFQEAHLRLLTRDDNRKAHDLVVSRVRFLREARAVERGPEPHRVNSSRMPAVRKSATRLDRSLSLERRRQWCGLRPGGMT